MHKEQIKSHKIKQSIYLKIDFLSGLVGNDTDISLYISKPARHIYKPVLSQAVDASNKGCVD